jgi:hypothetical protein
VAKIGIGRRTLDSKAGAALQPALRDLLEFRERGKAVARDEIERAKLSGGDDHPAHMALAERTRDLLRRGEYGQAAAQSSQRPGAMWSDSGSVQRVEAPPAPTPPAQQNQRRPPHRRAYEPQDPETAESQGIEL